MDEEDEEVILRPSTVQPSATRQSATDPHVSSHISSVEDVISCLRKPYRELDEPLFVELFGKRPQLVMEALARFDGPIGDLQVMHTFVDNSHRLRFGIKVNLLIKFVLSLNDFTGDLRAAKEMTAWLIHRGVDFTINEKYNNVGKLLAHNVAIGLLSSRTDRQRPERPPTPPQEWRFRYLWYLCRRPEFKQLVFYELATYWSGEAVPILQRLNRSAHFEPDVCRKFVIMLLIGGHFRDFDTRLIADSLNKLDTNSLNLLLHYGFDFAKCLINEYNKCNNNTNHVINHDIHLRGEIFEEVLAKYPPLRQYLNDCQYFHKPLALKDQIRIYMRRRMATDPHQYSQQLFKSALIPKTVSNFLAFKEFIEF